VLARESNGAVVAAVDVSGELGDAELLGERQQRLEQRCADAAATEFRQHARRDEATSGVASIGETAPRELASHVREQERTPRLLHGTQLRDGRRGLVGQQAHADAPPLLQVGVADGRPDVDHNGLDSSIEDGTST
jgi:hypothetical protein